jgi:hypothetical protein
LYLLASCATIRGCFFCTVSFVNGWIPKKSQFSQTSTLFLRLNAAPAIFFLSDGFIGCLLEDYVHEFFPKEESPDNDFAIDFGL